MSSSFHPCRSFCVSRAILPALAVLGLSAPQDGQAAEVTFELGDSAVNVIGNPTTAGAPTGIGGTDNGLSTFFDNANASDNTVTVTGGAVTDSIYGGFHSTSTDGATAGGNRVDISGLTGSSSLDVYGGFAFGQTPGNSVTASGNEVTINGGRYHLISGGQALNTTGQVTANDNTVEVNDITAYAIYGGYAYSDTATASGNAVFVTNGTVSQDIYGGYSLAGNAMTNAVTIDGGTFGYIYGGRVNTTGSAMRNTVTINGGTFDSGVIYGGLTNIGNATDNTVTIDGGTFGYIYGGRVNTTGNATGNTVTINGGTFNSGAIYGGFTYTGNATGNTVSGGTFGFGIYGGYVSGTGDATGNTVTITGNPTINALHGGASVNGGDDFTGNTLNLKTSGLSVGTLASFEYMNFYLPATVTTGDVMLTATNADINNATVNVGIDGASSILAVGDSVTLIRATNLSGTLANDTANGSGMQGVTLRYVFDLDTTATANTNTTDLIATVASVGATEESKALSEGFVSGTALVNQGADMAAGEGMARAVAAGAAGGSFGAIGGGSVRTNTGSHVDVNGVSLMAGIAGGQQFDAGRLTLGGFVEYGTGSYDTYNAFSGSAVRGSGDSDYIGAGLLGRMEFAAVGAGDPYVEGSARAGRATNDYGAEFSGRWSAYESASPYYGLHVGAGYVWHLDERTSLDLSAKYLWTHQEGDTVQLSTGDTVRFEDVDSQRLRIGGRLSYAFNPYVSPYAGAAFEHEFDGKARASTNGIALDAPSLAGNTGILEAGLTLTPSPDLPLSLDLGLQGYFGKREGIAGSLKLKLEM